jgi:hypothetical protein
LIRATSWPAAMLHGRGGAAGAGARGGTKCERDLPAAGMGKPAIRSKYANGQNTRKYPRILSPLGAKRRENVRTVL